MSAMGPDEAATIDVPAGPAIGDDLLERVAWLDLSDAQEVFARGVDADASYYVATQTSMEYRRFLLLRLAYPQWNIPAPPMLDRYWRMHAADRSKFAADRASLVAGTDLSPDTLAPPSTPCEHPPGQEIRDLYEVIFPCGEADLWGWPRLEHDYRTSAPDLGCVHIRLPSALDGSTRDALREEAFEQRGQAKQWQSETSSVGRRGAVSSGARYCFARSGPLLHDVHWTGSLSRLIRAQTGAIVAPTGANYLYHRSGDSMGVHTDPYGCELVLLTLLSGPVEPLHCHLDLADSPLAEIQGLAQDTGGLPGGGIPFEISSVPFLFSGQRIPHHREPRERNDEAVVLMQFFGSLLPSRATKLRSSEHENWLNAGTGP